MKTLVTLFLWIIAIYGTYSVIFWCAGPRLEDMMRGYGDPLTGKQRRQMQRESGMPSLKIILKNKCLLVWSKLTLISKRIINHLWHIFYLSGLKPFWESTLWRIYYWRLRRWKAQIQLVIIQLQRKLEIFSSWVKRQRAVFSSLRMQYWDHMCQGMIWVAYQGYLLDEWWDNKLKQLRQHTNYQQEYQAYLQKLKLMGIRLESVLVFLANRYMNLVLQLFHTSSLWESKWERIKHQLTQRLQIYLVSLHQSFLTVRNRLYVGRQRSCLRLGGIPSSQILSWMGNLHVAWSYNISYEEPPRSRAYSPDLWQYPKAPFSTADGVDLWNDLDRRAATRRARRVSGSSRLVLLFLCGLKLLHDAQRLRDPGQAMLKSHVDIYWTSEIGSITKEPVWLMWCYKDDKGTDIKKVKHSGPIRQKESSMAELWKGRMSRMSVEGVVGFVMWDYDVPSVYGYVHPQSKVRKFSRIHRLPLTTVAFEGPIDKG